MILISRKPRFYKNYRLCASHHLMETHLKIAFVPCRNSRNIALILQKTVMEMQLMTLCQSTSCGSYMHTSGRHASPACLFLRLVNTEPSRGINWKLTSKPIAAHASDWSSAPLISTSVLHLELPILTGFCPPWQLPLSLTSQFIPLSAHCSMVLRAACILQWWSQQISPSCNLHRFPWKTCGWVAIPQVEERFMTSCDVRAFPELDTNTFLNRSNFVQVLILLLVFSCMTRKKICKNPF